MLLLHPKPRVFKSSAWKHWGKIRMLIVIRGMIHKLVPYCSVFQLSEVLAALVLSKARKVEQRVGLTLNPARPHSQASPRVCYPYNKPLRQLLLLTHFIDERTEAQSVSVTYLRPYREVAEPGSDSQSSTLETVPLTPTQCFQKGGKRLRN